MAKNRLYKVLSRIVDLNPGEELIALLLFLYFFLIAAPFSIVKPLRDAFYLDVLSYKKLPVAYLLTAIIIGFVVAFHSKLQAKIQRHLLLTLSLVFFILTSLLFWWIFPKEWEWIPLAFWIWVNMLVVLMTQFWITVNDVFNPREVKRMIGFMGSGGILGGIVGYETAGLLAKSKVSNHLLLIACGMFFVCIFIVHYIFVLHRKRQSTFDKVKAGKNRDISKGGEPLKVGFKDCFNTVRRDSYLKLLAAMVTITWIVSTFIDFQFKGVIDINISGKDNLTFFFGHFYAALMVFAFFLQLLMTSNIIKRYGIRLTLLLFPLLLLLGSLGIAVFASIVFAIFLKGSDKSLSYSINQSVRELLYIPVSPELKTKAKIFIDIFINRFAKGIGALILMILVLVPIGIRFTSLVSVLFILVWILLNLKVSREYVSTVKNKLEKRWDRADKLITERMDVDYTKLVFDTIESKNRSSVLYAMHLFDLIKQDKLTPELKKVISYKSDEIRVSSLGVLLETEETTLIPETEDDISEEFLKKEIKEIMSLDVYQEVMKDYVEKVMSREGKETEIAKMEVAKALGMMDSHSPLTHTLEDLLHEESPEVSKYAVESAARLKQRDYVPSIVQKLSSRLTREDASTALEKYGQKIVGTLSDYIGDSEVDIELRKELVKVVARIGGQEALDFLTWELAEEKDDLDPELIDALDRIRSDNPDFLFQKEIVKRKIAKEVKNYCTNLIDFYRALTKEKKEQAEKPARQDLTQSLANIFKLLGLIYTHEDIFRAYQNIKEGTKDSTAYAVELLDNTLEKEIRDILLPLIENIPFAQRVKRCRGLLKTSSLLKKIDG